MTSTDVPAEAPTATRTPLAVARGVLKTMRPRQWVKNVLVLAAPFAGGQLFAPGIAVQLVIAFAAFSIAASGIYLINDARDVDADRVHPTKQYRPIAAGVVSVQLAYSLAIVLGVGSLAISWWLTPSLAIVMAVYIASQLAYCFGLKHQAVLDICINASGFPLRGIAGGVAANLELRRQLSEALPIPIEYAPIQLCTDNAAMIATLAYYRSHINQPADPFDLEVEPSLSMLSLLQ